MPGSGVRTTHDQCGGESVEYEVCGTKPCPPGQVSALSFRAAQCRYYNNRRVFGRVVNNWVPYTQGVGGINPCALVCEGEGEGIVYTFGKVTDGTHCKTDDAQDGLCVNGRCLRLSCDGRLGGTAKEDMCRVCGGHNETCTRHIGVFHTDLPAADQPSSGIRTRNLASRRYGYYEVSRIPRGATNVKVSDRSANFLALKAGNKFMLNGDWLIDWPGEVDAGGVSFTYTRAEDDSESLTSLGPTTEDLTLMVLLREHNPGIHYEYWTPNNVVSPDLSPVIVPLTTNETVTTSTPTTPTTTHISTTPTTTTLKTTTATSSTTTLTPRPAILTSVNVTRYHRPGRVRPPFLDIYQTPVSPPVRPSDNDTHKTSPAQKKPRKKPSQIPSKGKVSKDPKSRKGKKKKKRPQKPQVPGFCGPCEKPSRAKQLFCTSDFGELLDYNKAKTSLRIFFGEYPAWKSSAARQLEMSAVMKYWSISHTRTPCRYYTKSSCGWITHVCARKCGVVVLTSSWE
ncbi:ADAMTS-like protein 5 [Halocaridina rubra]|uniref:ADAMTS-like protein 5 n=1 Tax=Halocaridina rubra TaxID=373956 RepID=A0AAN8X068_HALRR